MCDLGPHLSRICDKRRTACADLFSRRRSLPRLVDCIRRQDRRGKALTHPSGEDRLSHEGLFTRYLVFTLLLTLLIHYATVSVAHSRLQCKCFRPQDLRFEVAAWYETSSPLRPVLPGCKFPENRIMLAVRRLVVSAPRGRTYATAFARNVTHQYPILAPAVAAGLVSSLVGLSHRSHDYAGDAVPVALSTASSNAPTSAHLTAEPSVSIAKRFLKLLYRFLQQLKALIRLTEMIAMTSPCIITYLWWCVFNTLSPRCTSNGGNFS